MSSCAAGHEKYEAAKGGLRREDLEPLVVLAELLNQIAESVGRSTATVRHWLGRYGLKTNAKPGGPVKPGARAVGARSRPFRGDVAMRTTWCFNTSRSEFTWLLQMPPMSSRARSEKAPASQANTQRGGRCQLCGYHRCIAALEFHHRDPAAKEFSLSRRGARSIERLRSGGGQVRAPMLELSRRGRGWRGRADVDWRRVQLTFRVARSGVAQLVAQDAVKPSRLWVRIPPPE